MTKEKTLSPYLTEAKSPSFHTDPKALKELTNEGYRLKKQEEKLRKQSTRPPE